MSKVSGSNLLAWGVVCCLAGMATEGMAQTNSVVAPNGAKPESSKGPSAKDEFSRNFIVLAPQGEDWTSHFHIGAFAGLNIGANFHESGNTMFGISGNNPGKGVYDDGYVREDQTGNNGGYTGYWGYQNASQYNAAANTLTFHAATSYSYSPAGNASANGDPSVGLDLAYGRDYIYYKPAHIRIGWELGLDMLPINIKDDEQLSATVNQSTYTYQTGGIVVPGAPYQGGSSGLGPLLPVNTPPTINTQTIQGGTVTGTRSLNLDLFTLRLGPSFFWDISQNLGLSVSGGPVISLATGNYDYDETITGPNISTHNKGSFAATDMTYGGYVNATLKYHIVDNGRNAYLFIGAQFTPMTNAHFSSGGRSAQLNLDGQVDFTAGMGWLF
jgi:hypothetical protein